MIHFKENKKNLRQLVDSVSEYRSTKVLEKYFQFLKRNRVLSKRKRIFIRKKILKIQKIVLQNLAHFVELRKRKRETITSIKIYYKNKVLHRCFKRWSPGCEKVHAETHFFLEKKKYF